MIPKEANDGPRPGPEAAEEGADVLGREEAEEDQGKEVTMGLYEKDEII